MKTTKRRKRCTRRETEKRKIGIKRMINDEKS